VWYVVVPLALPGIIAAGIFTFILGWNDFLFALVLVTSDELKTLPVGHQRPLQRDHRGLGDDHGRRRAHHRPRGGFFIAVQRYLVEGWGSRGLKG